MSEKRLKFRTPVRRKTRQKSGFNVGGDTPGSECKIKKSIRLSIESNEYNLTFEKSKLVTNPLFLRTRGIVAFGGYINAFNNIKIEIELTTTIDGVSETETNTFDADKNMWTKIGILHPVSISKSQKIEKIKAKIKISRSDGNIENIDLFGFDMGAIDYRYFLENDVEQIFNEKLYIYLPEIFYFNQDNNALLKSSLSSFTEGQSVILKSCNRCSRFLLIDPLNERNTISFSNHCVKRAPCTHSPFSTYTIKESDYENVPEELSEKEVDGKIEMHFGFQLECKSCKKFFVNAPLNPLRNSTQHREDSLRRRAIEILVDTLLGNEWIYHKFRIENKKEFDKHIWEKYGKKCFKCNKALENERSMDLDHTMPLASFYPLDESATCLCKKCNSSKSDKFPINFYLEDELIKLSTITGLSMKLLKSKKLNEVVVTKLIEKIEWFFDVFLTHKNYQKVRDGKRTSDLIYKAIMKQIKTYYDTNIELIKIYRKKKGTNPLSISI